MKRVVITGMGIVSCIGNTKDEVTQSLREGRSGIDFKQIYADMGLRSQIAGSPNVDVKALVDRKALRFMGDAATYAYISMQQAIEDAGLTPDQVSNPRTGIIAGSGGTVKVQFEAIETMKNRGIRRVTPYGVTQSMNSTVSACLATSFAIQGVNYSISSACATSAHCIGAAKEQIEMGKQDIVFAGGGEEEFWGLSCFFDAMGALSRKYNDTPQRASRAYDLDRDGFVIAGGGGMLVLESLEHALARNATIYAEITGYGATSDGSDMVAPSGKGATRCIDQALATTTGTIDYINAHGTSTPTGDVVELNAIQTVFQARQEAVPPISATKSLTGHSLGATGVHEAIYCLLMQQEGFIAASANIETLDPAAAHMPIVQSVQPCDMKRAMSNSFGFGGTNATLVFERFDA